MEDYNLLDFKRIFLGERSITFLIEIVFRTVIMYGYTICLLRLFGKRGMGQLSNLELAIIISFGSAVGDPMIGAEMPIIYGLVCITTVAFLQIGMEKIINKNHHLEKIVEGEPVCLVREGRVDIQTLHKENLSPEDLFRKLRTHDVTQLGEVKEAFFETSGEMTIVFHSPQKVKSGLPVLPDPAKLFQDAMPHDPGDYSCTKCGYTKSFDTDEVFGNCAYCTNNTWKRAKK